MAPPLLGLVVIMEAALWLERLYSAPIWLPPVVVALGCPTLLAFLVGLDEGFPSFMWDVGVVMGLPIALAFAAYWLPLRLLQAPATSDASRSGEPQNNKMQLTSPG
jgi:ABC-type Fe3+ transport system permease subunit